MRRWQVLERLIKENEFTSFVELGTKEGRTTSWILHRCPKVKVIACDLLAPRLQQKGKECGETYESWRFDNIKREFWQNCEAWKNRLEFHRVSTVELSALIEDESIDLVFIDASHDYESVKEDIDLYWPKVREGGILSGHDWQSSFPTVIKAVSERFDPTLEEDSVWWVRKS